MRSILITVRIVSHVPESCQESKVNLKCSHPKREMVITYQHRLLLFKVHPCQWRLVRHGLQWGPGI